MEIRCISANWRARILRYRFQPIAMPVMFIRRHLIAAVAALLAAAPVAADSPGGNARPAAFMSGQWDALLLHRITPSLDRMNLAPDPRSDWMALDEELIAPDFARALVTPPSTP